MKPSAFAHCVCVVVCTLCVALSMFFRVCTSVDLLCMRYARCCDLDVTMRRHYK